MNCVLLTHRALLRIAGDDAPTLLQDVISCDVDSLPEGVARLGALLTPQGKILFEFLLSRSGENGFMVETDADQINAFTQRMTMYRLRAKADFEAVDTMAVEACWDCQPNENLVVDERFSDGLAVFRRYSTEPTGKDPADDYTLLRIDGGVAEAGRDFGLSDVFPHDVLMDLNGGVSLDKGCFVGQEVVSRMQHRGTARRRIVQVTGESSLPASGTTVTSNERVIGHLGTTVGTKGLALVRIDRVAKAMDGNVPILTDAVPVSLALPSWTKLDFSKPEAEDQG